MVSKTSLEAPFVTNDGAALGAVLAMPPSAALVRATPLHGESNAIVSRALEQFEIFLGRLKAYGVTATVLEPAFDHPFQSAVTDLAVVFKDGAFLMRPSELERRSEVAAMETALTNAGVPIVGRIEAPGLLDGGDALLIGDTLFIGTVAARGSDVGLRPQGHGNVLGREQLAAYARGIGLAAVEVRIAAECRRLRSVVSPLDASSVVVASSLVDPAPFAKLQTILAPRGEDYAAGVLPLGNRRVLANVRFRETIPLLRKAKVTVDAIDLHEFGKAGITPSSLALALKR